MCGEKPFLCHRKFFAFCIFPCVAERGNEIRMSKAPPKPSGKNAKATPAPPTTKKPPIPANEPSANATANAQAGKGNGGGGAGVAGHKRSQMEQEFDRLRAYDKLEDGVDAIGVKGLQQLCQELSIPFNELDMLILVWKLGATQSYCVTRSEWLHSAYVYKIEHPQQIKTHLSSWKTSVKDDETGFTDMYHSTYDFIRGDDEKLLPLEKAIRAWHILLPEPERFAFLTSWAQWVGLEYKRPISRDVWRQLWEFARKIRDLNQYDPNDKWPTALDDFVEHLKDIQEKEKAQKSGGVGKKAAPTSAASAAAAAAAAQAE